MLHFAFDYLSLGFGILPATTTVAMVLVMFVWAAGGFVYVVFYARKALRWFVRKEPEAEEDKDSKLEKQEKGSRNKKVPVA